jgi:acyl-CoA synthetase (AMP-forming)/AMP-acid ligase II
MFDALIHDLARLDGREAVVAADGSVSWRELSQLADHYGGSLAELASTRIAIAMRPSALCFALLAALDRLGCDVFLFDAQRDRDAQIELGRQLQLDAVVLPESDDRLDVVPLTAEKRGSGTSSVTILTSGTTGTPKAARHTWTSLSRPIRKSADETDVQRWLLSYRPHLYAGLQVLLQCFVNGGTLVVDDSGGDVEQLVRLMIERRVQYVSATPSYWRRLFLMADSELIKRVPLVQVTLGGEVTDSGILTMLDQAFPSARIIHIYATTELGRCFSVTDRQAGFPAKFLDQPSPDGIEMRIDDGELLVKSDNRMQGYDRLSSHGVSVDQEGWTRTGDLVELRGDRVYFVGRRSDLMNVGGNKVAPLEVERVIRELPEVADVRVYPRGSSIAGQLVVCDIVASSGVSAQQAKQRVAEHCRGRLAAHARPRMIMVVDQIELTAAGKVRRV